MEGFVSSIETMGLVDGPGIRTVVFLDGCQLRCIYCHNPEMWNISIENKTTTDEILNKILKYKSYYGEKGGVTFSGGEPLFQTEFLLDILKKCKDNNIHTCIDTCGVTNINSEEILKYVDLVILDIKATNSASYKSITGHDVKQSLEFLEECQKLKKKLWLRTVIIPGINDTKEFIEEFANYIKDIKYVEKIELLPYHELGVPKYEKLNIEYKLKGVLSLTLDKKEELEAYLFEILR